MSSIHVPNSFQPAVPINTPGRRQLLALGVLAALSSAPRARAQPDAVTALLRAGGAVIAFRHALAPGTFDPPQFRLGDCSTQRNLSDEGRAQARRIGRWFDERGLVPRSVSSSPWCRCVDTAQLAFGRSQVEPALGSPRGATPEANARALAQLRQAVQAAAARREGFDVWVTHMFVLADLTGEGTSSGEGLVLAPGGPQGRPQVLARLLP
jgi:phosphohistidine phosphatase SixA